MNLSVPKTRSRVTPHALTRGSAHQEHPVSSPIAEERRTLPKGVSSCLSRRPGRGLEGQPQEDPATVARRGPARAATAPTQAPGRLNDAEPADRRAPNVVWAVDFQFDADGRPIKIVSIVDEHTRECLGGLVERNITGRHLIDELDRLAVDEAIRPCCAATTAPSSPAPRWPTGPANASACTSSHRASPGATATSSRSTAGCATNASNINMFWSLAQARVVISDWKADYNHRRRHPTSRARGRRVRCILRAAGGPVDLDRHPAGGGSRVDQVKRGVRAGVGE